MSPPFAAARSRVLVRGAAFLIVSVVLVSSGGGATSAASSRDPVWSWPIAAPHTVLRPFVAPMTAYAAGHRGIDIRAPVGAVVLAPSDGVVAFAGVVVDRPVLSIRHPGGLVSSYEPVESTLAVGSAVARGDPVGVVSTSRSGAAHCAESCVHFGVRLDGDYVSPLRYLGGIPWAVLLPTR